MSRRFGRVGSARLYLSGALGLSVIAAACAGASDSSNTEVSSSTQASAAAGSCATAVEIPQSLFVAAVTTTYNAQLEPTNTPNAFGAAALANFTFEAVMEQITKTGKVKGGGSKAAALALYQQLVSTLGAPTCTGDINGFPVDCPSESQISTTNPFTGTDGNDKMIPVALSNRFDLAPNDGANCGEYRIVFAINPANIEFASRFLMIFEATMPNPNPSEKLKGCLPVAQFWDSLSDPTITEAEFASKLQSFYFDGLPVGDGGVPFPPVIQAANYGIGFPTNTNTGQIRLNMLSDQGNWELRQFELLQDCPDGGDCTLTASNTFVANNPFADLFAPDGGTLTTFQQEFLSQVPTLAAATIPVIAMTTPDIDNGGESDESGLQLQDYLTAAAGNTALTTAIQGALDKLDSGLTPNNILNRATTQSCAGCHELSPGTNLGGGLTWPDSNGFVQVEETGQQSPALVQSFLPFRSSVLTKFISRHCGGASEGDDGDGTQTVGGGAVGAAN
jgi:hypothetical protein